MNAITEQALKRAETLRSLTLEPGLHDAGPQTRPTRRWVRPIGVVTTLGVLALGAILVQPDSVRRVEPLARQRIQAAPPAPQSGAARQDPPTAARPAPPVAAEIAGSGYVVATRWTTVHAKHEGRITHIAVDLGDPVKAGQPLIQLDNADARFALERARTMRLKARQSLEAQTLDQAQTRATLERHERLAAQGAVARQTLEETVLAARLAANAVAQAEQALADAELSVRIAQEALAELTVRAPFAGTVTRLDAHVGDTVLARADTVRDQQGLLTITDMSSLIIDADVAETHLARLQPGLRGEAVLDGFADRPFGVRVLRLAPTASAEKGTITLRLVITGAPPGARPHMAARVRIALATTPTGVNTP